MPQNPTNITDSTEFKDFCKSNNLEVFNLESINVFLYATYNSYKVLSGAFLDHDELITRLEEENKTRYEVQGKRTLELNEQTILSQEEIINDYKKRINKLEEMIMEIAKNLYVPRESNPKLLYTLFDKWNNKGTSDN